MEFCPEVTEMLSSYKKERNHIKAQNIPARCQLCRYDTIPSPFTWLSMNNLYEKREKIFFCAQHIKFEDTESVYLNLTDHTIWCRQCEIRYNLQEDFSETIESILKTSETPGAQGLMNLGNTCYMNSVIQVLSNSSQLKYICLDSSIKLNTQLVNHSIISEFIKLIKVIWAKNSKINPKDFVNSVQLNSDIFPPKQQCDAHEFLMYLLNMMNDVLKNDNYNKIEEIFQGQIVSVTKCLNCNEESKNEESFFDITLPIVESDGNESGDYELSKLKVLMSKFSKIMSMFGKSREIDIRECIKANFEEYKVVEDMSNWRFCYTCDQKSPYMKRTCLKKTPKNLILVLKRYSVISKANTKIYFPETLNFSNYLEAPNQRAVYNLYSIIEHIGFMNLGHYKSYCKNHLDNKWYCFNDSKITEMVISKINKIQGYIGLYELEE